MPWFTKPLSETFYIISAATRETDSMDVAYLASSVWKEDKYWEAVFMWTVIFTCCTWLTTGGSLMDSPQFFIKPAIHSVESVKPNYKKLH